MKLSDIIQLYDDFQKAKSWGMPRDCLYEIYQQRPPVDLVRATPSVAVWIEVEMKKALDDDGTNSGVNTSTEVVPVAGRLSKEANKAIFPSSSKMAASGSGRKEGTR